MAVGADERGSNSTEERDLTADRKVRLEWRIEPIAPSAHECLTNRATHNDAEKGNDCRTGVGVHPPVQWILVPHHVVSSLAISDDLRKTEDAEAEIAWNDCFDRGSWTEMERCEWHCALD